MIFEPPRHAVARDAATRRLRDAQDKLDRLRAETPSPINRAKIAAAEYEVWTAARRMLRVCR